MDLLATALSSFQDLVIHMRFKNPYALLIGSSSVVGLTDLDGGRGA